MLTEAVLQLHNEVEAIPKHRFFAGKAITVNNRYSTINVHSYIVMLGCLLVGHKFSWKTVPTIKLICLQLEKCFHDVSIEPNYNVNSFF